MQFTGKADTSEQRLAKSTSIPGTARVSDKSVAHPTCTIVMVLTLALGIASRRVSC